MAMFTKSLVLSSKFDKDYAVPKSCYIEVYTLWSRASTGDIIFFAQARKPSPRSRERCGDPRSPMLSGCSIMRAGIVYRRSSRSQAYLVEFDRITPLEHALLPSEQYPLIFYRQFLGQVHRKTANSLFHLLGVPLSTLRPESDKQLFEPPVPRTIATDMQSALFIVNVLRRLSLETIDNDETPKVNCKMLFRLRNWDLYNEPRSLVFMLDNL